MANALELQAKYILPKYSYQVDLYLALGFLKTTTKNYQADVIFLASLGIRHTCGKQKYMKIKSNSNKTKPKHKYTENKNKIDKAERQTYGTW